MDIKNNEPSILRELLEMVGSIAIVIVVLIIISTLFPHENNRVCYEGEYCPYEDEIPYGDDQADHYHWEP